jgi:hypothetical protein
VQGHDTLATMIWTWRRHTLTCLLLLAAVLLFVVIGGLLPGSIGEQVRADRLLVVVATVLWVGTTAALSTALIALRRPGGAGAAGLYLLSGLLALGGLAGLSGAAEQTGARHSQRLQQHQGALAEVVTLTALDIVGTEAKLSLSLSLGRAIEVDHITLRSGDDFCEGTRWLEQQSYIGSAELSLSLRCAGNVAVARGWRLSMVATIDGESATFVWTDDTGPGLPNTIRRPLP